MTNYLKIMRSLILLSIFLVSCSSGRDDLLSPYGDYELKYVVCGGSQLETIGVNAGFSLSERKGTHLIKTSTCEREITFSINVDRNNFINIGDQVVACSPLNCSGSYTVKYGHETSSVSFSCAPLNSAPIFNRGALFSAAIVNSLGNCQEFYLR